MYLWTAVRAFFRILFNRDLAQQVAQLLAGEASPIISAQTSASPSVAAPAPVAKPTTTTTGRSEALTLLATLQREGRWLDFLNEDLSQFADVQVGAVVRDIHRDCRAAIERMFAIRPLSEQPEGSTIPLTTEPDAARFRLLGNTSATATSGTLLHAGWQATKCDVPSWSGTTTQRLILMPSEVEIK